MLFFVYALVDSNYLFFFFFFFSSRRRHTRWNCDWSSDVCSSDLAITPEDYRRATEVTYLGTVWGTRAALKRMLPRNRGTIVQVGSALAYRSIPLQAPYCGAKSAIRGFTDSLRSELIHRKSRVHLTMVQLSAFN